MVLEREGCLEMILERESCLEMILEREGCLEMIFDTKYSDNPQHHAQLYTIIIPSLTGRHLLMKYVLALSII